MRVEGGRHEKVTDSPTNGKTRLVAKGRGPPSLSASSAPTADTIVSAGAAVFSSFVSLTSCVTRAQFSPLREALKEANSGGLEVLHDVRRGWRRCVWWWMDDATPSYSPESASRKGGSLAVRGRAMPVNLKRYGPYGPSKSWHDRTKRAMRVVTPQLFSVASFWKREEQRSGKRRPVAWVVSGESEGA